MTVENLAGSGMVFNAPPQYLTTPRRRYTQDYAAQIQALNGNADTVELGALNKEANETEPTKKKGITLANVLTVAGLGAAAYFGGPKAWNYLKNLAGSIFGKKPKETLALMNKI